MSKGSIGINLMPKFSVIIPLYNKGPHIDRAINSVLNQTFQDFELIVVDGGSNDNGPALVKSLKDPRINFFVQQRRGVSAARNQGVIRSRADLIAFLDADDEWMPEHLKNLMRLIDKYPQAGAYTTSYQIIETCGEERAPIYKEIPPFPWEGLIPNYFKSAALGEFPVWTSVVCIPKDIFLDVGGFAEESWYGEDADLFGKIALKYPIAFTWCLGGVYHREAVNRACNKKIPLEEEPFVKTAKKAIDNNLVSPDKLEDLKEYIANKEINRAKRCVDAGKPTMARKILKSQKTKYHRNRKLSIFLKANLPFPVFQKLRELKWLLAEHF